MRNVRLEKGRAISINTPHGFVEVEVTSKGTEVKVHKTDEDSYFRTWQRGKNTACEFQDNGPTTEFDAYHIDIRNIGASRITEVQQYPVLMEMFQRVFGKATPAVTGDIKNGGKREE